MLFMSRSRLHPNRRKGELNGRQVRPMLEALEDRVTPSTLGPLPPAVLSANIAPAATPASALSFNFTPNRLIFTVGTTSINVALTLTASGAPVNGGTVTLAVHDAHGNTVGTPQTASVSVDGQINAAYPLPAGLAVGDYTITATYHETGSPFDGATGTAILDLVFGPIPPVRRMPSPSPQAEVTSQAQSQMQSQTQMATSPLMSVQGQGQALMSLFQAAFTLYVDGVELAVDRLFDRPTDGVQANIDAVMASAGPMGPFFEMAGEMAVNQMIQGNTMM